ncbi:MAG: carboxypeptidase regulatory-like domain-containing protein [Acidobacteria bacterium]|nr:carboxypeptidase regulatory-like domain-containing protein [Acidobacteriota bacterium]
MLTGYVSDENYVAIAGVTVDIERPGGERVCTVQSSARGAIHAAIEPGEYDFVLVRDGFGSKTVRAVADPERPLQFRLLSDTLLGYAWPRWVRSGERSEFRVHSVEPYRLSLWRYGLRKEFVKLYGWFDEHGPRAVMQITPDGDFTQTGVRWNKVGYRSLHHTQYAVGPERSGLYYFHAKTESGREFFSFPWVVAPSKPSARIAVLASTNTWNAYNNFGGRSNYINPAGLPERPTVNGRQDLVRYGRSTFGTWEYPDQEYKPLSFDRPELGNHIPEHVEAGDPIEGRMTCGLAPAEWRLLAWLEREQIGYDLWAEAQLHDGSLDLDAYRVLIIQVHPEYWSRDMYMRVKAWVHERGGKLIYLGGNGLNCEVEFLPDGSMRCFSQLVSEGDGSLAMRDPADSSRRWESRFHRRFESEANLIGVVTTHTGIMTAAPYRCLDPEHWTFAGTGLQNGDLFGIQSQHERIHGGASGHETDKMSPYTPAGAKLLAKGLNPDQGGSEIVYYETAPGGAVYSVGSINWVHSLLVDDAVSRITGNVVRRFADL